MQQPVGDIYARLWNFSLLGAGRSGRPAHKTFLYLLRLLTPYVLPLAKAQATAVNGTAFEAGV